MTLLEYVTSLQDQGLSAPEINTKVAEWKNTNQPTVEVEEEVEVKVDPVKSNVAAENGAAVATKTEAPGPSDSANGESQYQKIEPGVIYAGMTLDQMDSARDYKKDFLIGDSLSVTDKDMSSVSEPLRDTNETPVFGAGWAPLVSSDAIFREKEKAEYLKKPLDSRLTDFIVDEQLYKGEKYEQFKDQAYDGRYKEDFREDAGVSLVNSTYNPELLSGIKNFNYDEFLGFMNSKGYSDDYLDAVENPDQGYGIVQLGLRDKISSEEFPRIKGYHARDLKKSIISQQRAQARYFDLYVQEKEADYLKKIYSSYIRKNPEKFEDSESVDKAFLKAKNHFDKEYGEFSYGLYDYNEIKKYKNSVFPDLAIANAEAEAKKNETINKIKSQENLEGDLWLTSKKAVDGYMSGAREIAYGIADIFGIDMTYAKNLQRERDIVKEAEDVRYQFVMGKEAEVDGVVYIKDDTGAIYDTTNKTVLGSVSKSNFEKINKALDESDKEGSSFSGIGSLQEFAGVAGRMTYDIIGNSLTAGTLKGLGVTKLASAIKIPENILGTMTYYSANGYMGTKQNTYNQFIEAGISSKDADEMSDLAAKYGALISGVTSIIAPNSKYVDNLNKNLFGTSTASSLIKNTINGYKKSGISGAGVSMFNAFKKLKPTNQGILSALADGTFEVGQEFTQQGLEVYGLNPYINSVVGKDVLQQDMSVQEIVNLSMTSFGTGSALANLNLRGLSPNNASQQLQNLYQISMDLEGSKKVMNAMVANKDATQEQVSKVLSDVRAVSNQMSNIPSYVSSETQLESAIMLQEINDLQEKKKRTDEAFHETLDDKIKTKKEDLANIVKPELEKSLSRKGAKKAAEQIGVSTFETFDSEEKIADRVKQIQSEGGKTQESTGYGQAVVDKDGNKIILINDQAAAEDNNYTTDQHEVLHPFFQATFEGNPELAIRFGKSLLAEIINNPDIQGGQQMIARFSQYLNDPEYSAENTWEEVIPLVSEALSRGDIVYNEKTKGFFESLKEKISNVFKSNKKQPLNIRFNTGKDVFNFLKEYNKTIESGRGLSESQIEVAKKGAKGALVEEDIDIDGKGAEVISALDSDMRDETEVDMGLETEVDLGDVKASKRDVGVEASAKVQEIYDTQGEAGAFDIIDQFKPIVKRIVDKRQDAPNFDRQLLTDEIETGKRGIFDLIREYKPESGVPLAAYINKFLPARAIEASQRVLGEEFTDDVTEAKGVMAEEVITEVAEKPVTRKIKPSSFISNEAVTKIKEQVQEKIKGIDPKNLTFKKLGDLAPEIIAAEIGIPVKKLISPTANLSKGDATAIQQFVNKNADKLLKILPEGAVVEAATDKLLGTSTGVPKGLLNAFYTKQARLGKGAGLAPFKLNKGISKADFLETFGIVEGKKAEGFDARSPQAQALKGIASLYGKLVTNEIVRSDTDLSLEAKKDVAAGKSKAMASKRLDTKSRFSTASNTKTGGVSKANNVDPISRGSVEYMGGKGGLKTETRWTPSKEDAAYIPTFMNKAAGLFGKDFFTTGNFAFGGRSLIGTRGDLTNALKGAVYNEDAPQMPKRKPYKKTKKYDKNFHEKLNTKEFLDNEKAKMPYLKFIFEQIQADLKTNPNHLKYWEAVLNDAQNSQGHFMRFLAPIAFYPVDKNGNPVFDKDIVEEHTMPQSNVAAFLLQSALDGNIEQDFGFIEDNYFQGALLLADDKKTRGKGYNYISNMGETFLESDNPSSWMRYNNENVNANQGGIDFNAYKLLNGQTIAESLDAGLSLQDRTPDALENQRNEILKQLKDPSYKAKEAIKVFKELAPGKVMASKRDSRLIPEAIKYDKPITVQTAIDALAKTDKALELARKIDQPVRKIRVFDFDDTLARTKSNVLYTMPDGTTGAIDAATFAKEAGNMEAEGAQWDFSEFSKVMQGSKGPLLDVAKIIADKRGTKDVFVLTARPADAAGPIKEFLASMGLDIPLANITGLGDGTPEAKAGWIMGKAAEGYNDFYFADDHTGNVKAVKDVLSQVDVKSKVQLAKASKRQTFDTIVNDMIEDSSGIETYKKYSAAKAKTVGASKGKYNFLIPPSAEDFTGLLYKMLGKGKKGDAQMAFLKTNLLDTYNRAESAVTQAKVSAANDFVALKTKLKTLPKTLSKETGIGKFTYSHAVRVAAWTKQGMDIPGLSKRDIKELNDFIDSDAKLRVFTEELIKIQKGKEYPAPDKDWLGGNITTDIIGGINKVNRAEYQQEWRENIDIIFSEENMNKMEAAYGSRWREAMEDSIRRMKSGSNRPIGGNRITEGLLNWLNNSVGAVMFLNTRSALLQTISAVNFINLSDNNIAKAGAAFANQKQFWGDFMTLMNSDYLVERRNGLKINVSESEIADAVKDAQNKPKAAIAFLLSKGFVMTRFADSFAIATGGSTFYRNRVKKYVKEGVNQSVAEEQAFADFKAIAEESQQSSSPSKISQQQASAAGRVILAWANTPMQYARIQKRAAQDLANGRGDWKTNISKIVYYGAVQNLIFNMLQQSVFALGFGDDDEETDEAKNKKLKEKAYDVANGMVDSQLKGLGVFGAAAVASKNTLMTLYEEYNKKGSKYENAVDDILSFSPPLGSKVGKIAGGFKSASWNMETMKEKGFSLDNPAYMAGAQVVTGFTNVPLDRAAKKINNIRGIASDQSATWQKIALSLGWSTWDVGLGYYGGFDKEEPLTPKQQLKLEVDTMKKETSKADQVKTLLGFGLTKKQVRELKNENNRVKKILELQKKDKDGKSKV